MVWARASVGRGPGENKSQEGENVTLAPGTPQALERPEPPLASLGAQPVPGALWTVAIHGHPRPSTATHHLPPAPGLLRPRSPRSEPPSAELKLGHGAKPEPGEVRRARGRSLGMAALRGPRGRWVTRRALSPGLTPAPVTPGTANVAATLAWVSKPVAAAPAGPWDPRGDAGARTVPGSRAGGGHSSRLGGLSVPCSRCRSPGRELGPPGSAALPRPGGTGRPRERDAT